MIYVKLRGVSFLLKGVENMEKVLNEILLELKEIKEAQLAFHKQRKFSNMIVKTLRRMLPT
jgi:hypothetical protein